MNELKTIMIENWKSPQNYAFAQGQRKQVPSFKGFMKDVPFSATQG